FHTPSSSIFLSIFFFFNDPATTEIYTLSLHDALPISPPPRRGGGKRHTHGLSWRRLPLAADTFPPRTGARAPGDRPVPAMSRRADRKSTRLNSSHVAISYAVFCLKKKKTNIQKLRLNK